MDIDMLTDKVVKEILAMGPGASGTIAELAIRAYGADSPELDDALIDLEDGVSFAVEEEGLMLDKPECDGMAVGLQSDIPFVVRRIVNGQRGSIGIDEITSLSFSVCGYLLGQVDMRIVRGENGTFAKTVEGYLHSAGSVDEMHEVPLDGDELAALANAIKGCGVESWYREYPHGELELVVLDGNSWELTVCLADGTCVKSSGSNDYPDSFDEFTSALVKIGFPELWG